jgi:SAM-dependent methyltransferase
MSAANPSPSNGAHSRPVAVPFDCCSACLSKNLSLVFEMPNLPQIGVYLDNPEDAVQFPTVDQGLTICEDCGHIQLQGTVDPEFLYNETFKHRTSESPSAMEGNKAFADYIKKVGNNRRFERLVEIGCNDAFLLQNLLDVADAAWGIDPLLKGHEKEFTNHLEPEIANKINVVGDFVENIDFESALGGKPDLIVSSFVFEHIREPVKLLQSIFEACADDALVVIQVPGTEMLLDNCRFDQLSHQHYQQFTLDSFRRMVETAGGVYIDHHVYYPVWGAIMFAFRRGPGKGPETDFPRTTRAIVEDRKARFDQQISLCHTALRDVGDRPIYGLGAAQNFPTLAYFMGDVNFLKGIIDDNPARQYKYYPWIDVQTIPALPEIDYENAAMLLTGPDYGRALINRSRELKFRQVVLPFNVL